MFLAKLIIYLLISFVLPYFFTFFNYFLCLCWLSNHAFTKIFNFIMMGLMWCKRRKMKKDLVICQIIRNFAPHYGRENNNVYG